MIQSIQIKNFQSHKDTRIDLADGMTILVGTSDSGKTSILRAINWVVNNRPRGRAFVRHGSDGECNVVIRTDDRDVHRFQKSSKGEYRVDGEVFTALAGNVPPQVQEALPLLDLNVSSQLQSHYLVLDSPGKIAKAINDVVHLEEAEEMIDTLASRIRKAKAKIETNEDRQDALESSLRAFEGLGVYRHVLKDVCTLETILVRSRDDLTRLDRILDDLHGIAEQDVVIPEGIEALLDEIGQQQEEVVAMKDNLDWLSNLVEDIRKAEKEVPDTIEAERLASEIEALREGTNGSQKTWRMLRGITNQIEDLNESIASLTNETRRERRVYNDLLNELETCPTCGQEIDDEQKELVLENMR